jgi:hypothetical protein
MRHSLVKNFCPACGGALLGELHSRRLALFRQKLANQPFSEKLLGEDLFDIALFMLVEFFPPDAGPKSDGQGEDADEAAQEASGGAPDEDEGPESAVVEKAAEETYEEIRAQVRKEVLEKDEDLSPEDLDSSLKVSRLKRIAKESGVRNAGTVVRRLSGD